LASELPELMRQSAILGGYPLAGKTRGN